MNTRERKEARIARRLEWAEKREAKVAGYEKRAEPFRGDIAFNTQPGHIPARAALIRAADRASEDAETANYHRAKADGIAAQLDRSIYSDDHDAPERLRERIAELERTREHMKATNAAYRKGPAAYAAFLKVTPETEAMLRQKIEAGYSWCRQPHPAYELTNLGGNIRRLTGRLKEVAVRAERTAAAEAAPNGVTVRRAEGADWATVTFAEKPDRETLDALRAAGFGWGSGSWHGPASKLPAGIEEGGAA